MSDRKIFFKCPCGAKIEKEIGYDKFVCENCGMEIKFIYNPKEHLYEMEIVNAGQHNNTTAA